MNDNAQMFLFFAIAILFHFAMFFGARYIKDTRNIRKSLLIIVPNVLLNAAIMFSMFYSTNITLLPERIVDGNATVEQRIARLENYTEHLEIYLEYSRQSFFRLVGILAVFNAIPLIVIALALSDSKKQND